MDRDKARAMECDDVELTPAEAAALVALRAGADLKSRVAVQAGLDLRQADRVLRQLATKGLAAAGSTGPGVWRRWRLTGRGRRAAAMQPADAGVTGLAPGWFRPGSTADRILRHLDRSKNLTALAAELEVTPQRVHQCLVRLLALGAVRSADPDMPTWFVARRDDPTRLLRRKEARALSPFPNQGSTALRQVARRLRLPTESAQAIVDSLLELGLVSSAGDTGSVTLLQLTHAGRDHPQRDASADAADRANLPVKSDRVRSVLDHLADAGPTRTASIGRHLGIELHSMNALMQYLKRKGLVRKAASGSTAPYEITETGRTVRVEMMRQTTQALAGRPFLG